jgi:pyruvate/2-oxoglutarate dehydrogenase complex dihydrolipoamide acyltransferase (E2) component
MPNTKLKPFAHASSFRRIAAASWNDMYEATIYGQLEVRVEPLEKWIAEAREKTGRKVTITHCVARAMAILLARHPDMNAMIRWRRLYLREDVDVFLQVAIQSDDPQRVGKTDLSGTIVRQADKLSTSQLCDYVVESAKKIRTKGDKEFERTKSQANLIPGMLFHYILHFLVFLQVELNIDTGFLGAPRDPFGSCMITSVGMFDAPVGYAPFFPLARCPIVMCIGSIQEKPVVEDGKVVPGRVVSLQATMDHRVIDGVHAGLLSKELKELLTNPEMLGEP